MSDPLLVVDPKDLISPAAQYPLLSHGTARLVRSLKPAGLEWLRDWPPYQFLKVPNAVHVTELQTYEEEAWQTWMVDEPAHWMMMKALSERVKGPNVCIGGLGLGLIAHALAHRTDLKTVIIVERNQDVIDLMRPNLPPITNRNPRFITYHDDFWHFVKTWKPGDFQTFVVDLWRGPVPEHREEVLAKRKQLESRHPWPGTESLFFAYQMLIDYVREEEGLTHG